MIKRVTAILCAAAMMISLTACSEKAADYSGETITGQVTAVDGSKVTLHTGELNEPDRNAQGEMPQPAQSGNGQPDNPDGEMPQGNQTWPDSLSANGQMPPDKPEDKSGGEMPSGKDKTPPGVGMPAGNFTAGEESITVDLDGADIQAERGMETVEAGMEDITADTILVVELAKKMP